MSAFEEFGVMPELIAAVQKQGWELPRDIQAECIPLILGGGDVMAAAETGSGKTGAFGLPLVQIVYETLKGIATISKTEGKEEEGRRWNVEERDGSIAVSEDESMVQSRSQHWAGIRTIQGINAGKHYYEVTVNDEGGVRVGWGTRAAKLDLGTDAHGFGFGFSGKKSHAKKFEDYGESFSEGDVVGCYFDADNWVISFSKNGNHLGVAFNVPNNVRSGAFHPMICLKNGQVNVNFGEKEFKYGPTADFTAFANASPTQLATSVKRESKEGRSPLAIVLEPTLELAAQTLEVISSFSECLPSPKLEHLLIVGGSKVGDQVAKLRGGVDIVVATPGRLLELIDNNKLDLSSVRFLIFDEADQLIHQGLNQVMKLYNAVPKSSILQVLMFSATLHSSSVLHLGEKICRFPTFVDLKGKDAVPESVDYVFISADPKLENPWKLTPTIKTDEIHSKDSPNSSLLSPESLSEGIKLLKPHLLKRVIDVYKMDQAMIFCRTKIDCDHVEAWLKSLGGKEQMTKGEYSCVSLHSDKSSQERKNNVQTFKDLEVRFLICTDVAARGLDIVGLPFMINYTLPDNVEDFIHRTGRVGRAERLGLSISIVGAEPEKVWYHSCSSRGKNCSNTKLKESGGCAIWYDEKSYFDEVQARLQLTIPQVSNNVENTSVQSNYGQKKGINDVSEFIERIEQMAPLVSELILMEENAQKNFWNLKTRWAK